MNNLTTDNYFDDTHYLSTSRFKKLLQCELGGLQDWGDPTPSMLVGSYVDASVGGTLAKFIEEHPEIISSRGKSKGELKAEFKQADDIIRFIEADEVLQQFFSGEKQRIFTGEISGVPFKAMLDIYSKGIAINDLKVLRTVTDYKGDYIDFVTNWGYHYQGAIYRELVFQNTGEMLPFYLCVVTKENPVNSVIVQVDQFTLDSALDEIKQYAVRFYDLMQGNVFAKGCGKCPTCIANRRVTPIISMEELQGGM